MIDPNRDDLIRLHDVCKLPAFVKNGKPKHISSVYKFATSGMRASNGKREILETLKTPIGRVTTREAIADFCRRLSGRQTTTGDQPVRNAGTVDAARAERDAAAVLDAAGI